MMVCNSQRVHIHFIGNNIKDRMSSSSSSSNRAIVQWLADVSDMVAAGEPEEDEGGGGWLDSIIASTNLPVCARTCGDGELYYRTLGAWSVSWSRAPLDRFLPAWFRLPARRRRALLRELKYFVEELREEEVGQQQQQQQGQQAAAPRSCWVARMCARNDAHMMRALAAVEPLREVSWEEEHDPFLAALGGPLRRAVARRLRDKKKHQWAQELVRLCVTNNAVQCLTVWGQSRAWRGVTLLDREVGLECVRLGRLDMLRVLVDECCCRIGYGKMYPEACYAAAAAGQLQCLRFLMKRRYTWKKFMVWNVAQEGWADGCADCARYLLARGCPTQRPPNEGRGGLMDLLAYGAQNVMLA